MCIYRNFEQNKSAGNEVMSKQCLIIFLCFGFLINSLTVFCTEVTDSTTLNTGKPILKITSKQSAEAVLDQAKKILNSDPVESEKLARKVLLYSASANLPLLTVHAQLQIADILFTRTRYTDAMKIALEAKDLAEQLNAEKELAAYFEISGKIKSNSGDYSQSLNDLFNALKIYDKLMNNTGKCQVLNAVGTVYYWQKNYDKALKYYTQAYNVSVLMKDMTLQARVGNNLGLIYMVRKDYKKALLSYTTALAVNQKSGQDLRVGGNYLNIGLIYMNLGKFEESLQNFMKARAIFTRLGNYSNLTLWNLDMGYYYEAKGDKEKSIQSFRGTFNMARKYGLKGIELEVVSKLHDLYRDNKLIDSAYKYAEIKADIKDSLEIQKTSTRLSIAELQYQYENKISEQKLTHQRLIFYTLAIVCSLIALILFSILFISRQRQKNKAISLEKLHLEDEIEFKNRELTLNVLNLLKRNEFILNTSRRLLDLSPDVQKEDMKEEVVKIAKSLQDETAKETWEEFDLRFQQVHSGFYDRLLLQFPDLTPNELKLCGLLKLNLSTKEITELTGQRREAIEMARFRLRKHLGLNDQQVNLITFLSKI